MSPLKTPLSSRFKFGFWLGGISLAAAMCLLATSRFSESGSLAGETARLMVTSGSFSRGVTLYDALKQASLSPLLIQQIGDSLQRSINPRSFKNTDTYELVQTADAAFHHLTITRGLKQYIVSLDPSQRLALYLQEIPVHTQEEISAGSLKGSLWESMSSRGMPPELIMQFADIFAWNIDFLTEPRDGDRFALVWEKGTTPDGEVTQQKILAALYEGRALGRHLAFLHNGEYYDTDGNSIRKAFLHAPLNFRRISSGFSRRRFHPVLRYFRPHLGIDYAAPRGTPVVSVGNGTVVFRGWKRAYGNFVQIRHNGAYTTCYGHLSRFARNLRRGARVSQGQVIGYVGSTGWSTGPHLDFRVLKNGRFVNFIKLKFPSDKRIPASENEAFQELGRQRREEMEDFLKEHLAAE
ncbi:MAG TPA: peptidoglycan DD-metalloendopeptidase family protein [Elusimicrobiota bacterium]|nr:peptidoglycan DD-metalloendopeptidase family protein [Elusimicrobiota bacterium]